MAKGRLCNQGCGTRIFFQIDKETGKNRPYNMHDKEKHICPIMEMAKMYGGKWNTIPLHLIRKQILECYRTTHEAQKFRNIDQWIDGIKNMAVLLQEIMDRIEEHEKKNREAAGKLDAYKKKLVKDQYRRAQEGELDGL